MSVRKNRRPVCLGLWALALCLLCACQPNPEKGAAAAKDEGYIEAMVSAEAEDGAVYEAPESLAYELSGQTEGTKTHVRVSADVLVPEGAAPVVAVSPADISFDAVSGLLDAVGADRLLYDMESCAVVEFKSDIQRQIDSYEREMAAVREEGGDTSFYMDKLSQLYQAQAAAPDGVEEANAMLASGQLQPVPVLTGGGYMATPDEGTQVTNDRIEPFDLTAENYGDRYYHLVLGMGTARSATLTLNARCDSDMPQIMEYTDTSAAISPQYTGDMAVMEGFPLSLEDAVSAAEPIVRAIDPGLRLYGAAAVTDGLRAAEDDGKAPIGYQLIFTRDYGGMQETYAVPRGGDGNEQTGAVYSKDHPQESLIVVVTEEGIFSVTYTAPQTVAAVEVENAGLLPFEEIKEIFDRNIVLTKAAGDTYIRVDAVRLGMMRIARPNSGEYLAVPVWDFLGSSVTEDGFSAHAEEDCWEMIPDSPNVSFLTVNAINGAVISRDLGY